MYFIWYHLGSLVADNLNTRTIAPKYSFSGNFQVNKCYSVFQNSQSQSDNPPVNSYKTLLVKVNQELGFNLRACLQLWFKVSIVHFGYQLL